MGNGVGNVVLPSRTATFPTPSNDDDDEGAQMGSTTDLYVQVKESVEAVAAVAMRADNDTVQLAIDQLGVGGLLDEDTIVFLRRAHPTVLGLTTTLQAVLDTHQSLRDEYGALGCRERGTPVSEPCRTLARMAEFGPQSNRRLPILDEAVAWRIAREHLGKGTRSGQLLIAMEEFGDGYVARPIRLVLPNPPAVPGPDTERVLIIDKRSGEITTWPLMTRAATAVMYRRYKRGEAMTFDISGSS